jgi:hypothetical protein
VQTQRWLGILIFTALAWQLAVGVDSVYAQRLDGSLRGVVKDATEAVIPGAQVTALNESTGVDQETITSSAGIYLFPNLLVGKYTITVQAPAFKKLVLKNVQVLANQVSDAAATLQVGDISDMIVVVGGGERISTTSSQAGGSIEQRAVVDLPNPVIGGNPLNLALTFPNTTSQGGGVLGEGGSVGGNRPHSNNFTIDGVDNNDISTTGSLQPVIQDAVEEFNLLTNQFSAEFGHSTAGQFNIVTKSGTNELHGSAFYYGQNRNLNAGDNLVNAAIRRGDIAGKPRFDLNRAGGTIGGPAIRNRLFLFGAYQFQNVGRAATGVSVLTPTQAGLATLNSMAASPQVKELLAQLPAASSQTRSVLVNGQTIPVGTFQAFAPDYGRYHDYQVNADADMGVHQLHGRFLSSRYRAPNVNYSLPLPAFMGAFSQDSNKVAFIDNWTISSSRVNDFRISYSRFVQRLGVPAQFSAFPNVGIDDLGLNFGPEPNSPQSRIQNVYQWLNTLNFVSGRHQFKAGAERRYWIAPLDFLPYSRGQWDYANLSELVNDLVPTGLNSAMRGAGSGFFAGNQSAVYGFVQDDFKAGANLTLNLGLRYEYTTNPRDAALQQLNAVASVPGLFDFRAPRTDKNNFAPRVGFAFAPKFESGFLKNVFGEPGRSSLRGGFGIAYDMNFQNLIVNRMPPQLQTLQTPSLTCAMTNPPSWCAAGKGFLAGGGLLQVNVPPTTQKDARSATQSYMVDQRAPKAMTWSLSFQRELSREWTMELRYLGTRGLNLPVQTRLNAITVFETHPELALPTYFSNTDVPATVPLTAPTRAAFLAARDLRYTSLGFDGGFITAFEPIGNSIYHAGSIEINRRFGRGLFAKANYTFSRTIDDSTNEFSSSTVNPRRAQNPYNMANERGLSALDMPHKLSLSWVWEMPKPHGDGLLSRHVLAGWQLSGTYYAQSGQPITALSGADANGDQDSAVDRAVVNPQGTRLAGASVNYVLRDPATGATSISATNPSNSRVVGYVAKDPSAVFVVAQSGAISTVGRNTIRTPGLNNWNLAIFKNTAVAERKYLQFRMELFNAFNHRQYSLGLGTYQQFVNNALSSSYANVSSLNFLNATQFSGGSRAVQYALKFLF